MSRAARMLSWRIAAAIGVATAVAGCNTPKDLLRWTAQSGVETWAPPRLAVSTQAADPPASLTVRGLPDRASAAYITQVSKQQKDKDPDKLRTFLAKPIAKGDPSRIDATRFARVLVADVERSAVRPGDRYVATRVEVKPALYDGHPVFQFVDYQLASTDFNTISVGNVTFSHQVADSLQLTPQLNGAAVPSATVGPVVTDIRGGSRNLSERSQLSVSVTPELLTVARTGAEGIDLTGNTLVKLSLQFVGSGTEVIWLAEPDIQKDDGSPKSAKDADIKVTALERPKLPGAWLCARIEYADRRIDKGAEFLDEGRHTVTYVHGSSSDWAVFPAMAQDELRDPVWVVMGRATAVTLDTGLGMQSLAFASYSDASQFREWLQSVKASVLGKNRLRLVTGDNKGGWKNWDQFDALRVVRMPVENTDGRVSCEK